MIYTDAPTTVVLGATNITSSSLLAQCNITDLDGVSGTCVVKDTSGTMIHQSVIGADVLIQNLTPNTTYILEITGTANKKNSDGTLTSTPIHQVKNIQTIDVAPIDHPESLILPTLTIGTTKVSFAGGSVTDTDNPSGFLTNIQYIVHDGSGNTVNPTQLIPNSLYTYTIQYDTKNGANGQTVTKTSAVVSFRTLALSTPPAPTFSVDDDINTINWNGQVSSDYEVSFDNGKTYSAVPTNFGSGVVAVWLRKKAVLNVSNPSPVQILTFTQNNTP